MKDILSGWREHGLIKSKHILVISILTVFVIITSGIAYYLHSKKSEKEELERKQQQTIINEKNKIRNFYSTQFHGYQYQDLITILGQILSSSYIFTYSGFTEDIFTCNEDSCDFSYKLKKGAIFNVQDKVFFNQSYEGIISSDSIDFSGLALKYADKALEDKIINRPNNSFIPYCNDYINYIYAYNSSKSKEEDKIKLNELPSSSVANLENKYRDFADSHQLLFSKFEMVLSANPLEVKYSLDKQPYLDSYIFKSIEKLSTNNIKVTGVFACKR